MMFNMFLPALTL